VILDDETVQTPHLLAAALLRERVDTVFCDGGAVQRVADKAPECFAGARQVAGGRRAAQRPADSALVRAQRTAPTQLYNVYGPTETTTFALCHPVPRDFDGTSYRSGGPAGHRAVLVATGRGRPRRVRWPSST